MEEIKRYKKYIYISKKVIPELEEYCMKNNITLVTRFINEYNLEKFMQTELRNLNSIDYLIIDLQAIENLTSDDEIISKITLIRKMYNLRIIIIAQGYKHGNILLGSALMYSGLDQIRFFPTNSLTKPCAGFFRIASGLSYWRIWPWYMMQIRSAIFTASSMSWVTKTMVFFIRLWRLTRASCSPALVIGSRAEKGSSMRIMSGSVAKALATPTLCSWPPESWIG